MDMDGVHVAMLPEPQDEWDFYCANNHRAIQLKQSDGLNCPLCDAIAQLAKNERDMHKVLLEAKKVSEMIHALRDQVLGRSA